ncbi:MAG: hypothetical protein PHF86_03835 [Candidatus Nanoarchaeia archaeon]|nr:hypothetical protein [Candidatus Nanoarchaeia archaeon]
MKKLAFIVFLLVIASVTAEIVTEGSVIDTKSIESSASSLDIKDAIKANLIRAYNGNEFEIDITKLPSVNDEPYVLTQITDMPIVIRSNNITINGKNLKFVKGNAFIMPLTNYVLTKNLRIYNTDKVIIEDSKFSFPTSKVVINKGVVYVGENNIPVKIMPNMIFNDLSNNLGEQNIKKVEILSSDKQLTYLYQFERPAKLFYLFNVKMNVDIKVNAQTGKYSLGKPIWAIFTAGENKGITDYNFTQYSAF